jgi:hypothetical protein
VIAMRNRQTHRGSAMVMVIGLLGILLVLGTTFYLVAQLYASQSQAIAERTPADPLAGGIVAQVRHGLARDLHLDPARADAGPYAKLPAGPAGWLAAVDAPDGDVDPCLASIHPYLGDAGTWTWRRLSNLFDASDAKVSDIPSGITSDEYVDTDGDGVRDALLMPTGVFTAEGKEYYVALRLIDLSGLLCVNTACDAAAGQLTVPLHPVNLGLRGMLDAIDTGLYAALHKTRCGGTQVPVAEFDAQCAQRLLNPEPGKGYLPFSPGDELFLRWYAPGAPTEAGRVHDLLANLSPQTRIGLTTYSATGNRLRRPAYGQPWPEDDFRLRAYVDVGDDDARQTLYQQMYAMLKTVGVGASDAARKHMAAAFVANLWARQDASGDDRPWTFKPKDGVGALEDFVAFGLEQRPVITEAYARHEPESAAGAADEVWGYAVEVMNPTAKPIPLNGFRLYVDDSPKTIPAVTIAPNGGRVVLYDWGKGSSIPGSVQQSAVGFPEPWPSNWKQVEGLTFLNDAKVQLVERIGGETVPVDRVTAADLNYGARNAVTDPREWKDIQRDDEPARARYNVPAYAAARELEGHRLGRSNNMNATHRSAIAQDAKYPVPVERSGEPLWTLAECGQVYLAGPRVEPGNVLKPFSVNVTDGGASGLFSVDALGRGRLDLHPLTVQYGGYTPGEYPDVPLGALVADFFSMIRADQTRTPDPPARVYGRVNVNSAPKEVLRRLPWPASFTCAGGNFTVDPDTAVDYLLAYRDRRKTADGKRDYTDRAPAGGAGVQGLRTTGPSRTARCFLSRGEVAVPLADYANALLGWSDYDKEHPVTLHKDYFQARDALYAAVANCVSVSSDTFAANIVVQLGRTGAGKWHYVAIIDRGNVFRHDDSPAVLLFAQVQ